MSSGRLLADVKRQLDIEKERMFLAEAALYETSENIVRSTTLFNSYRGKIKQARKALQKVVKRSEQDGRYLRFAWYFFCGVAVYIILKRLLLIRIAKLIIRLMAWLLTGAYHTLSQANILNPPDSVEL